MIAEVAFWLAVCMTAYAYVGYPLVLWLLAAVRTRPWRKDDAYQPLVSVIVPAHNEESVIGRKVEEFLAFDYPAAKLELIVVCDGCDDATEDVVRHYEDPRLRVISYQPRQGKAHALNVACDAARGEVLLFTDADIQVRADALKRLMASFADERVGGVSGRTVIATAAAATADGERLKFALDQAVRTWQSRIWTMAGADGGVYAVRRRLFQPLAVDAVADDLALPLELNKTGYRVVYEPSAVATQLAAPTLRDEARRKARIVAGGARAAAAWLHPRRLFRRDLVGFHLLSGKLLKYCVPLWLAVALVSCIALRAHPFYRAALVAQAGLYGVGLLEAGAVNRLRSRLPRAVWLPLYFCSVNAAAMIGLGRALRGRQSVQWERALHSPGTAAIGLERTSGDSRIR